MHKHTQHKTFFHLSLVFHVLKPFAWKKDTLHSSNIFDDLLLRDWAHCGLPAKFLLCISLLSRWDKIDCMLKRFIAISMINITALSFRVLWMYMYMHVYKSIWLRVALLYISIQLYYWYTNHFKLLFKPSFKGLFWKEFYLFITFFSSILHQSACCIACRVTI